jgi:sigma-B regulation protein RsbU (phosphoserine phosphatase)
MYPKEKPDVPGLEFSFFTMSCDETGGDYFDFIRPDDKTLYVIVGDVVGHGIGAALLMATARANLRALCSLPGSVIEHGAKEIVESLNSLLMEDMDERTFMTFFLARMDLETFAIDFVNAGHDNPVVASAGEASDLEATGIPLGIMDLGYEGGKVECFADGDCMMLTTDGVWEVRNPKREMYGKDRLKERFRQISDRTPDEIVEILREEVLEFVDGVSLADDFTLVVIKRNA